MLGPAGLRAGAHAGGNVWYVHQYTDENTEECILTMGFVDELHTCSVQILESN